MLFYIKMSLFDFKRAEEVEGTSFMALVKASKINIY